MLSFLFLFFFLCVCFCLFIHLFTFPPAYVEHNMWLAPSVFLFMCFGLFHVFFFFSPGRCTYNATCDRLPPFLKVLLKAIAPYTRVKLPYLASELNGIPLKDVEDLLVSLILDGKVDGKIDQVCGRQKHRLINCAVGSSVKAACIRCTVGNSVNAA